MKVLVVGLGGVGTHLVDPLCRYLSSAAPGSRVVLMDGDAYEPKNRDRQVFSAAGVNKAVATAEDLIPRYPELIIEARDKYLVPDEVFAYVTEDSVVFSCVDNHASRKMLSDYAESMDNVLLISGGNDYHDGNVQVYSKRDGTDQSHPLTYMHPDIQEPDDKNPAEMSCQELVEAGSPQFVFTNLKVAVEMLNAFWNVTTNGAPAWDEVYFDIKTGAQRTVKRK